MEEIDAYHAHENAGDHELDNGHVHETQGAYLLVVSQDSRLLEEEAEKDAGDQTVNYVMTGVKSSKMS